MSNYFIFSRYICIRTFRRLSFCHDLKYLATKRVHIVWPGWICSALTGHTWMHIPQPVHKLSSITSRRRSSICNALVSHLPMHDMQNTPFHARQLDVLICKLPMLASSRSKLSIDGQASAQSPQNVQPVVENCSQGRPACAWSSGCMRTMPCEQAEAHSLLQLAQASMTD